GETLGDEDRVVAEASRPTRLGGHGARAPTLEHALFAQVAVDEGERADVGQGAARGDLPAQPIEVLRVGGARPGEARRAHARSATEGGRLDPGAVGDRR